MTDKVVGYAIMYENRPSFRGIDTFLGYKGPRLSKECLLADARIWEVGERAVVDVELVVHRAPPDESKLAGVLVEVVETVALKARRL